MPLETAQWPFCFCTAHTDTICMYLLNNPDNYTNLNFATCYWKSYVSEVWKTWVSEQDDTMASTEKVTLLKRHGCIIGL